MRGLFPSNDTKEIKIIIKKKNHIANIKQKDFLPGSAKYIDNVCAKVHHFWLTL